MPTQTAATIDSTTQQFLDIYDITHDVVIMKDGSTSMILTVDAMNFGLLAEEEQDAVMYAYAGLLNSLNYPIEVIIKSQTKDVTNYLRLLKNQEDKTGNQTMRKRIGQYRNFVSNLIQERNVLDKKFYVSIPTTALEMGFITPSTVLPGKKDAFDIASIEKNVIVEKAHNLLEPRRDHLIAQFARIGLYAKQLNTQEIIQLFYVSYNPEAVEGQAIADSKSYTSPLVQAGIEESYMVNATQAPTPSTNQPAAPAPEPVQPAAEQSAPEQPVVDPVPATPQPPAAPEPISTPTPAMPTPTTTSPEPAPEPATVTPPAAEQAVPAMPTSDFAVAQSEIDAMVGSVSAEPEPTAPAVAPAQPTAATGSIPPTPMPEPAATSPAAPATPAAPTATTTASPPPIPEL